MNVDKTKVMELFGKKSSVLKVYPCGICGERVVCNFIKWKIFGGNCIVD